MNQPVSLKLHGKELGIRAPKRHELVSAFVRIPNLKPPSAGILYIRKEGEGAGNPSQTVQTFNSPDGCIYQFAARADFLNCITETDGGAVYGNVEYHFANGTHLPFGGLFLPGISMGTIKGVAGHLTLAENIVSLWEVYNSGEINRKTTLQYHVSAGQLFEENEMDAEIGLLLVRISVSGFNSPQNPLLPILGEDRMKIQPGLAPLSQMSVLDKEDVIGIMEEQGTPKGITEAARTVFSHDTAKLVTDTFNEMRREKLLRHRREAWSDRNIWDPEGLIRKIDSFLSKEEQRGQFKTYSELTEAVREADAEIEGLGRFVR